MIQQSRGAVRPLDACASEPARAVALEARSVWASFGDQHVLTGANLRLESGERLALIGCNGAGKTTLLRVLAGALRPTSGEVRILGRPLSQDLRAARASIGVLGHQSYLYPELSSAENLAFYARLYRVTDRSQRVEEVLGLVGLSGCQTDRVATLSRGMVQRLALARAILHDPPVLLLDEPDASLDERAIGTLATILDTGPAARRTILLTTHDLKNALRFGDHVAVLHGGRLAGHRSTSSLDVASLRSWYAATTADPGSGAGGQLMGHPAGLSF